jgi:crotonobetainyl-CoA:carnitine CoA-transferase CaiB-like acyl-CoA transferase
VSSGPLTGIRVLDFTRMFAGPCAAEVLGDLGAEVMKVEEPRTGDPTRRNLPFWGEESAYFMSLNRGKLSVSIDLKAPEGSEAGRRLAATADVVLENYRPGVMNRLGLDYLALRELNSNLVFCSLSGFGATGPLSSKISFDLVNQAMSGMIDLTGDPAGRPVRIGVPIGDMAGGLYMAAAAVAGLRSRQSRGTGCWFDLSLHDVLISMLGDLAAEYLAEGSSPTRTGHRHRYVAPNGCYEAQDGWLVVSAVESAQWQAFTRVLGVSQLAADPRYASPQLRKEHEDTLDGVLGMVLRTRPVNYWTHELEAAGVPVAPVLSLKEALESPTVRACGIVFEAEHPTSGAVLNLGSPIVVDGSRAGLGGVSPLLGADTSRILREVGYRDAELTDLTDRGVVRSFRSDGLERQG